MGNISASLKRRMQRICASEGNRKEAAICTIFRLNTEDRNYDVNTTTRRCDPIHDAEINNETLRYCFRHRRPR